MNISDIGDQCIDQASECARILTQIFETMEQHWSEVQERFIRLEKEKDVVQDEWKSLYNAKDEIIEQWKSWYKMKEQEAQDWKEQFLKCQEDADRRRQIFDQTMENIRDCLTARFGITKSEIPTAPAATRNATPSSSTQPSVPKAQGSKASKASKSLQAGRLKPKIELIRVHHQPTKEARTPTASSSRRPPKRVTPITPITPSNANRNTVPTVYEIKDSPEPQPMEILTVKKSRKRTMSDTNNSGEDDSDAVLQRRTSNKKPRKVSKAGPSHTTREKRSQNDTRAIQNRSSSGSDLEEYDELEIRPGQDNGMLTPHSDRRKT